MNFGQALEHLKRGLAVRRKGHSEMLRIITRESKLKVHTGKGTREPIGEFIGIPWNGGFIPWQAPNGDLLADDWEIVR